MQFNVTFFNAKNVLFFVLKYINSKSVDIRQCSNKHYNYTGLTFYN